MVPRVTDQYRGPAPLAGAVGHDRPYTHRHDGQNDQVPLRPEQRANLTGPLCMGARVDARTTPYKTGPPPARSGPGNVCTHDCGPVEVGGSMWKARAGSPLVAAEPSRRPFLPCQAGRLSVTGGAQVPSVGPRFRNGGSRPSQPWLLLSSGRRKRPWSDRPGCQRCSERPAMGAPVTPETCDGRPARGPRGPFGPRHRWSLWIVGRWPVLIPRFPGGAAPREPPFVGVSAGSGPPTRGPYAAARQRPRGRSDGVTCVRTGSEGLQWGQLDGRRRSPGTLGRSTRLGERSFAPSGFTYIHSAPSGARGPGAVVPSGGRRPGAHQGDYRLKPMEVRGNNRSVMPLDVLGRTRATLTGPASTSPWPRGLGNLVKPCRAGDRALQLLLFNEECLVGTSHQLVPITSLPFVHTARRYYRLNGSVRPSDWLRGVGNDSPEPESEPAEGSLPSAGPSGSNLPPVSIVPCCFGGPAVFERPPGRPRAPGPAPAEDPNMNAVLKHGLCVGPPSPVLPGDGPERQRRHRVRSSSVWGFVTRSVGPAGASRHPNFIFLRLTSDQTRPRGSAGIRAGVLPRGRASVGLGGRSKALGMYHPSGCLIAEGAMRPARTEERASARTLA
ncbi:hypothetical protein CNMCM6106_008203 [Aspergillus hiratsukae]|uniref:Uncharacterized protein n=1 Tax=Aspergillus hiratsukae TaxID=1194566 RepID=A0A8H6QKZ3_9EURO|nr:hypothetical protein CNMCM6106_008203 [Aspergillus hiratsukae]